MQTEQALRPTVQLTAEAVALFRSGRHGPPAALPPETAGGPSGALAGPVAASLAEAGAVRAGGRPDPAMAWRSLRRDGARPFRFRGITLIETGVTVPGAAAGENWACRFAVHLAAGGGLVAEIAVLPPQIEGWAVSRPAYAAAEVAGPADLDPLLEGIRAACHPPVPGFAGEAGDAAHDALTVRLSAALGRMIGTALAARRSDTTETGDP